MKLARLGLVSAVLLATLFVPATGRGAPVVQAGFVLYRLTDELPPETMAIAIAPPSWGSFAYQIFVACPVQDSVVRVDRMGGVHPFATTPIFPSHLSFLPGSPWGNDLLVSSNQDPASTDFGILWDVTPAGTSTRYARPEATTAIDLFGAGGMAFSNGGPFGDFIYTGTSAGFQGDPVVRISRVGLAPTTLYRFPGDGAQISGAVEGVAFGSGLAGFSTQLFVAYFSNAARFAGGVFEFDPAAVPHTLVTSATTSLMKNPTQIAFGPGGKFGHDLYIGDMGGRILTVDATGAASVFVDSLATSGTGWTGITFQDSSALFFTEPGTRSLYVLFPSELLSAPTTRTASGELFASPTPSSGAVSFTWSVAVECRATLAICDAQGRWVRTIADERLLPGRYTRAWDGRLLDGRAAPAGVYWASVVVGEARSSKRIVILPR